MSTSTARTKTAEAPELTVYFDGACPLCTIEIDHYKAQTGAEKIRFVDASAPGAELGADLSPEQALARFHVRDRNGALCSGAAGFASIWQVLPKWRWLARITRLPGVLWMMECGYRGFLPLRPILAWCVSRRKTPRTKR
ncbi:MAG: thiol-disulfide oxidoreductase DCC family protein [Arenibacterium sp.]